MEDPSKAERIVLPKTISESFSGKSDSIGSLSLTKRNFYNQNPTRYEEIIRRDKRKKKLPPPKKSEMSKIIEKYKLKDKSISKKLNTPYDRKLAKTCWPIEMKKVCRIKQKPMIKEREKPDHKSLHKRKFSDPTLFSPTGSRKRRRCQSSDSE